MPASASADPSELLALLLPTPPPCTVHKGAGEPAHDEHLFIIIHQTFELWFRQILWDLRSVVALFAAPQIAEDQVGTVVTRFERVSRIMRVLISQFDVLETMSPLSFLEFRDFLFPASGFQSLQFRLIEITLGLKDEHRVLYGGN